MKKKITVILTVVFAAAMIVCAALLLRANVSLMQQAAEREARIYALEQTISLNAAEMEIISARLEGMTVEAEGRRTEIDILNADVAGKRSEIESLTAGLAGKNTELESLYADMVGKSEEIDTLLGNLAAQTADNEALRTTVTEKNAQLEALQTQLAQKDAQAEQLTEGLAEKDQEIAALNGSVSALKDTIAERDIAIAEKDASLEAMNADAEQKARQLREMELRIQNNTAAGQRDALIRQLTEAGMVPCVEPNNPEITLPAGAGGYRITGEYTWDTLWSHCWATSFQNTSGGTKSFRFQVILYDDKNNVVAVKNPSFDCLADGYEGIVYLTNDEPFHHVAYSVTIEDTPCREIQTFVDVTAQKSGNKAILTAQNHGADTARYVEYTLLFQKGGNVVGSAWGYLTDNDSELKAGATELREEICYEDFDTLVVYFEGRK